MTAKRLTVTVVLICVATCVAGFASTGNAHAFSRTSVLTPRAVVQRAAPSIRGDKADMKTGVANITKKAISN
jgi:hypothetical protein